MASSLTQFHRVVIALLIVAIGAVALVAVAVRHQSDQLDRLVCLERLHATAAVAAMVPDSEIDVDGRVTAAKNLGAEISEC